MRLAQLVHQKDSLDQHNADAFAGHYTRMRTQSTFKELPQLDTARRGDLSTMFETPSTRRLPSASACPATC